MDTYSLKLNDETVLDAGSCGTGTTSEATLWLEIIGKSLAECAAIFSMPQKTAHMVWDYAVGTETFDGYTDLFTLTALNDDRVRIGLRKVTANEQ